MRRLSLLAAALVAQGCDDQSYRHIGTAVAIVAQREGVLAAPSREELIGQGRRAIPAIETALHTAPLRGRLALVGVLEQIGDGEAAPILRHFAVYDVEREVREACEAVLTTWATAAGERGDRARDALARMSGQRALGEGPLPRR